jgi:hypothetical protein
LPANAHSATRVSDAVFKRACWVWAGVGEGGGVTVLAVAGLGAFIRSTLLQRRTACIAGLGVLGRRSVRPGRARCAAGRLHRAQAPVDGSGAARGQALVKSV